MQKDLSVIKSPQDLIESVLKEKDWSKLHRTYRVFQRKVAPPKTFFEYCVE